MSTLQEKNNGTKAVSSGSSIGLGTIVMIVLVILRATGHIAMGWFWVISSIVWVPLSLMAIILGIAFLIMWVAEGNKK